MIARLQASLILLSMLFTGSALAADNPAALWSPQIRITGAVAVPQLVTVDSLKKMQVFTGGEHQLVCRSGENKKHLGSFKGVLLKDLLEQAQVRIDNPKDSGRYVVLITSTNNYPVSYTYNELMYNATGNNVYVIFEEDGAPITEDGGAMSVITLNDTVSGVRHVKWPARIEVLKLD